jgi:hypothetical protein
MCDTTCYNPNSFRFNTSIEAYNISFKSRDKNLSNAIIPASITRLVVETQRIEKGTPKTATPINRFLDYNNVSRKQDKESRGTLTKSRDEAFLKSVLFCFNSIVEIRCFKKNHSCTSDSQNETKPEKR